MADDTTDRFLAALNEFRAERGAPPLVTAEIDVDPHRPARRPRPAPEPAPTEGDA